MRPFLDENIFLSTPSARRATAANVPEGGPLGISIHALREEGDQQSLASLDKSVNKFLSTPSARRATSRVRRLPRCGGISIHALREEGDLTVWPRWASTTHFYPRPPRGGRHATASKKSVTAGFLSTPSARRATAFPADWPHIFLFLSTPSARRATKRGGHNP